jgi:hypothetical protein
MKTKILLLASLICLFGFNTACNDSNINTKNENNLQSENPLAGTKWELTGFVDVENGKTKPPEEGWGHPDYPSYSITFETDSSISGQSGNIILGNYHIEDNSNKMSILVWIATMAMGYPDEELYVASLNKVQSFIIKESDTNILQLFYNDNKNYLEFIEIPYE